MLKFVGRRLVLTVPVLIGVSLLVFLMLHLVPGDPAQVMLGGYATKDAVEKLRADLGLKDPLPVQYFRWLWGALQGDLGYSIRQGGPVLDEVVRRFRASLLLAAASFVIALGGGVLAGVASGTRRGSSGDRLVMLGVVLGISLPSFYLAMLLIIFFSVKLGWLPMSGIRTITGTGGPLDVLNHMILPSLALAAAPLAVIARMTRTSILEVIREDYVRTARAKGLREGVVVYRHALKNALIPVINLIGLQVGFLLSATALVEVVFSWPGLGQVMVQSVLARDFPLTQGCILAIAISYVIVNLVTDVLHAFIDPRIRVV